MRRTEDYDIGEYDRVSSRHDDRSPRHAAGSVDLLYLYATLRKNTQLIVTLTLASVVVMFFYLNLVPPTYSAWAQVILDTREERITPAAAVVSNLDVTNSVIAGEVVTIRSNVLLGQVVDMLDLTHAPEFDPRQSTEEALFAKLKRMIRRDDPPNVMAARLPESAIRDNVIDSLRSNLQITQIGISYVIGINFNHRDPEMAAKVANAVAQRYINSQLDNKLDATLRANAWLADRLGELSVQVEAADDAVVTFKSEMIDLAQGSEDSINQLLAELNTRLVGSSTDRADAEVRFGQIGELMSEGGLSAVADVVTSPLLETLQNRRAQLASDLAQLAGRLGRKHPEMVSISAQIENTDLSMQAELRRKVEELRGDVIVTRNRETALKKQIEIVSERADSLSKASVRLGQLQRSADATRLVYENFLARFKETTAQADFQTPEARVIGAARVPVVPSAPRKTLMIISAFAFGLSGAIVFVFIRNMIYAPITTARELEALSHRPNIGLLPHVWSLRPGFSWLRRELSDNPRTNYAEHVNSLQAVLFDKRSNPSLRTVMITSSIPDEGKTSLCVALAKALKVKHPSVLLLDTDLRQPDMRSALHLNHSRGCLIDFLEGKGSFKDLVQTSEEFGIEVVTPARACKSAAELLSSAEFENMFNRLKSRYSLIVLNAPPVLYLADALLVGKMADSTLFTVRCGRTRTKVVHNSIQRLQTAGVKVDATVLSMVRKTDTAARESEMYSYGY